MVFNSRSVRSVTRGIPTGNGERSIFEERIIDGRKRLVVTGKEDFHSFVQASKDETLIENILKRYAANGDISVLNKVQGFYGDVTGAPSSLQDMQNMLIKAQNDFNSMPVSVREKFDNSFDKYVSSVSKMNFDEFVNTFGLSDKVEGMKIKKDDKVEGTKTKKDDKGVDE